MDSRERAGTAVDPVARDGVDVEFDEEAGTYRVHFDATDRLATEAVISTVSAATGVDVLELPPLYDAIDPDALGSLFSVSSGGSRRFRGSVSFAYAGCLVTVDGRGTIEVEPGVGSGRPTG